MAQNDLQKWVTTDVDFYSLLGITLENCSETELRRAYRKTALKYHPDKVGKDFDPAKYELFQAANDVLSDPELKARYDGHRNARLQRQRANELFEGKRRLMKEDLEARERGVTGGAFGGKRGREEEEQSEMLKKLAEEGRKRRTKRVSLMGDGIRTATFSPAPPSPRTNSPPLSQKISGGTEEPGEDVIEKRERELEEKIREAKAAKAKRKEEKKARKSGVFVPLESSSLGLESSPEMANQTMATPTKCPDTFRGLKADEKTSASPIFSFSPSTRTPQKSDFAATKARLKVAEKQRLEEQIRQQEADAAN
jgi:DnaJ family protein C protein 17